jgi:hypothetical protein
MVGDANGTDGKVLGSKVDCRVKLRFSMNDEACFRRQHLRPRYYIHCASSVYPTRYFHCASSVATSHECQMAPATQGHTGVGRLSNDSYNSSSSVRRDAGTSCQQMLGSFSHQWHGLDMRQASGTHRARMSACSVQRAVRQLHTNSTPAHPILPQRHNSPKAISTSSCTPLSQFSLVVFHYFGGCEHAMDRQ